MALHFMTPAPRGGLSHFPRVYPLVKIVRSSHLPSNEQGTMTTLKNTLLVLALFMAATVAHADDAAIRQKIIGYWSTGRHVFLFKSDGNALMMGGTSNMKWAVHNGMYYEGGDEGDVTNSQPHKILSLTNTRFVTQREEGIYTWKRISANEAAVYGKPGVIE
jgi:hypothetical protein